MTITHESIRAAGGIVHRDGNIFFTSLEQLQAALSLDPNPSQSTGDSVRVEGNARDAARYRWLRTWTRAIKNVGMTRPLFVLPHVNVPDGCDPMRGAVCQHLDAAIDAELALQAESKEGGQAA